MLYFNSLQVFKNKINYCVDMLRLSCQIKNDVFQTKIGSRLLLYQDKLKNWNSTRVTDFYYNFNYTDNNCSFWFGYISNSEKYFTNKNISNEKCEFNFTIEFNPNKVQNNSLLLYILKLSADWVIKSCDFAIDVPTNILNICGFDKNLCKSLITYDNGGDDKTYYIGKNDNRIKIYNKKNESSLDYDLTRIEITKKLNDFPLRDIKKYEYNGVIPELFINEFQLSFMDIQEDKTLLAVVYAVLNGFSIHNLTRDYKKKVKNFLHKKKAINIDSKCITQSLKNYVYYYFPIFSDVFYKRSV